MIERNQHGSSRLGWALTKPEGICDAGVDGDARLSGHWGRGRCAGADHTLTTSSSGPTRPVTRCVVPRLAHMTIGTATLALRRAHCRLGRVHRPHHIPRHHRLRVIKQSARPRTTHAPHFPIDITVT